MGNIRDIKRRIGSVKSTRQITNAMKMVAASNLRKAQSAIINARPYANCIDLMLRTLKLKNPVAENPLLNSFKEAKKQLLIVVTADRGLCGSFNTNIIRTANNYLKENPNTDLICLGKKCYDSFKNAENTSMIENFIHQFNTMKFEISKEIADFVIETYLKGEYTKVSVLYNEFKSVIQQNIVTRQILPVQPIESDVVSKVDFIYEPDEDSIIEELAKKYVDIDLWRIMLESSAAEQGARMTAMDSATENASELINNLTLQYNRERQASITTEIIEIASGAEAIS